MVRAIFRNISNHNNLFNIAEAKAVILGVKKIPYFRSKRTNMKLRLILFVCILISVVSCTKQKSCPDSMKLSVSNAAPLVGSTFTITAPKETDNNVFQWAGPFNGIATSGNVLEINNASYSNRGWYYCSKSNGDCGDVLHDSIYVDVKLLQETAPCNPTNNYITFSNIPSVALTSVTEFLDPTWNGIAITGNGAFGYPSTFKIVFNSYNGNVEPIDGTYITANAPIFDVTQQYNEVSVSFLYSSTYYHCHAGQKLYVTHVNGKIQATFCSMVFSSGSATLVTGSGRLTKL